MRVYEDGGTGNNRENTYMRVDMCFLYYSPHPHPHTHICVFPIIYPTPTLIYVFSLLFTSCPPSYIYEGGGRGNNKENTYMRVDMCFLYYSPHPHPHI
jgi:hypothetical protein